MKRGISPIISVVLIVAFVIIIFFLVTNWAQREIVEESVSGKEEAVTKTVSSWDVNAKINSAEIIDNNKVNLKIENTGNEDIEKFKVKVIGENGVDVVETSGGVAVLRILSEDVVFDINVGDVTDIEIYPVVNDEVYASVKADIEEEDVEIVATTGVSCLDILNQNPDAPSGNYEITPQGNPINVYCDMETDDGGWTLAVRALAGSEQHGVAGSFGVLTSPDQGTIAKLSTDEIIAIGNSHAAPYETRFLQDNFATKRYHQWNNGHVGDFNNNMPVEGGPSYLQTRKNSYTNPWIDESIPWGSGCLNGYGPFSSTSQCSTIWLWHTSGSNTCHSGFGFSASCFPPPNGGDVWRGVEDTWHRSGTMWVR